MAELIVAFLRHHALNVTNRSQKETDCQTGKKTTDVVIFGVPFTLYRTPDDFNL
jgi:hypothetical protein